MHQFYIEDLNKITLSKSQIHQLKNVLRKKEGDTIRLVDAKGKGAVVEISDDTMTRFDIIEPLIFEDKNTKLKLIVSLIRNERLEWMIQKAAETGVDEIVLFSAEHGVVKSYGKKEARKLERFNTIAFEASEQAYRQKPLMVSKIIGIKELEKELLKMNLYADTKNNLSHFLDVVNHQELCVLTGPEGGFSDEERLYFESLNIQAVSLGDNILRAETAPIAVSILFSGMNRRGK